MYYGDEIPFSQEGPRIPEKALLPIGIAHKSRCWGIWVPSVPDNEKPPHLLISTFYPENWRILFRITLKLSDTVGALAKAAAVLEKCNFNILSTQCSPSGHRHTTWNIIGEALAIKRDIDSLKFPDIPDTVDVSTSQEVMGFVSTEFSPRLFKYGLELKSQIESADAECSFIHGRFKERQTLLYKTDLLPEEVLETATDEIIHPIKVSWLQNLAAFRIYGNDWRDRIPFRYNAQTRQLRPAREALERFSSKIRSFVKKEEFPIVAIASFDHQENYVRIVIPSRTERKRQFAIQVNYNADFSHSSGDPQSSKGLLKEVASRLTGKKINLHYVSNATTDLSENSEKGVISLIGASSEDDMGVDEIKKELERIDDKGRNFNIEQITVNHSGAKRLFISRKIEWMQRNEPELLGKLCEVSKKYGLFPVWVGSDRLEGGYYDDEHREAGKSLTDDITEKMKTCNAFLQVIPSSLGQPVDTKEYDLQWVNFELGFALAMEIPFALCLDEVMVEKPEFMKVIAGWKWFPFDKTKYTNDIVEKIEPAIQWLANKVYG